MLGNELACAGAAEVLKPELRFFANGSSHLLVVMPKYATA